MFDKIDKKNKNERLIIKLEEDIKKNGVDK